MNSTTSIRTAITVEIRKITTELDKLKRLLAALGDGEEGKDDRGTPARHGRPAAAKYDPQAVLSAIQEAGKINAIALAHKLRRQGVAPVSKAELIELGVKVTGVKGGTTYSYAG